MHSQYDGMDLKRYTPYTSKGYQGPSMKEKSTTYLASEIEQGKYDGEPESELLREKMHQLVYKIETRRAARDKANKDVPPETPNSKTSVPTPPPPEPSQTPSNTTPPRVPKPVIGKLPPNYVPPQERTVGAQPKDDPRNFRYRAPIETEAAVERVIQAGLSSIVSIRQEDLLAIAPEYRKKVKEGVTSRRIGLDGNLLESEEPAYLLGQQGEVDSTPEAFIEEVVEFPGAELKDAELREVFFNERREPMEGDRVYVAKEAMPIRAIWAKVGDRPVHCILDWGCSIIAMSLATCNALGISFDPTRRIPLQSANGITDWTLGVAEDVPFRFTSVTAILQIHIVDSPAYDVLLGRPFEVVMEARTQGFRSGDQHITLTDPNTERVVTIPTCPREPPHFVKGDEKELRF